MVPKSIKRVFGGVMKINQQVMSKSFEHELEKAPPGSQIGPNQETRPTTQGNSSPKRQAAGAVAVGIQGQQNGGNSSLKRRAAPSTASSSAL